MNDSCRELAEVTTNAGGSGSSTISKQTASHPNQHHKLLSGSEKCLAGVHGNLNKSCDSVKMQCLRSRTRSLDRMKTSDMKNASAKSQHSDTKQSGAKVGRLRSQSEERDECQKLSANKSRPRIKLTIPHTPQLLK